jgi:hypothetical protein
VGWRDEIIVLRGEARMPAAMATITLTIVVIGVASVAGVICAHYIASRITPWSEQ